MTGETETPQYVALEAGDPAPQFSQNSLSGAFNLANPGGAGCTFARLVIFTHI